MMYYHCMEKECESTFKAEKAKFCPCCGSRVIRHALGDEVERADIKPQYCQETKVIPIYAMGA